MARNTIQNLSEKSATRGGIETSVDERQAFCSQILDGISAKQAISFKGALESLKKWLLLALLFGMGSQYAHAQASNATCVAQGFLAKLNEAVFFPLIILLTGVALFMFLWGAFLFVMNAHNPTARERGRKHMIYGVIGLLVMVSAAAILGIAANSFSGVDFDPNNPYGSGC